MEFSKLIPVLKILISDGLISIHSENKVRNYKSEKKEIKRQINLLNDAFVCSDENIDLLFFKDN